MKKITILVAMIAILAALTTGNAFAALNLEGQSGIFLNTLAYPIAPSKTEASTHSVDLDSLGSVSTFNLSFGLKNNVELGLTRITTDVAGVSNQNLLLAKWQFLPETNKTPAVAVWGIYRKLSGSASSPDFGLSATKVVIVAKRPLVLDIGARNTKAQGLGLFGFADNREWKLEGSFAYFVRPNIAVGAEFKQQVNGDTWKDVAFRYIASNGWNVDLGIANLSESLDNQFAFAVTRAW